MSERGFVGVAGYATVLAVVLALLRGGPSPPPVVETRIARVDTVTRVRPATASQATDARAPARRPVDQRASLRWEDPRTGAGLLREFLGQAADVRSNAGVHYKLDAVIATLPDPIDSHLDWMYDGGMEAIRRAAERAGYVIDRYWLPWPADADSLKHAARTGARPPHRTRPGVLLLRSAADVVDDAHPQTAPKGEAAPEDTTAHRLLLVYVVGEVPTAGVAKAALSAALDERAALFEALRVKDHAHAAATRRGAYVLPAQRCTLRVVGPTLSGSAVSLRLALDAWTATRAPALRPTIEVVSGTATGDFVEGRIAAAARTRGDGTVMPRIGFRRTTQTTREYARAAVGAARRMGISQRQIAVVREQTTQYGQQTRARRPALTDTAALRKAAEANANGPLEIPFPMNISGLRAEYARTAPIASASPPPPGMPGVRVDLLDSARAMESPPAMSRDLTAASVEVALDDIARTLAAHQIRAVVVIATDVRDKLFLVSEIRRRVRDVQMFVYGSSALLVRADRNRWLRGAIVTSTYPLYVENQFWQSAQPDRLRSPFASDIAEGIYNAVLWQLGEAHLLTEYGTPFDGDAGAQSRPPVWLSVVGAHGVAPLGFSAGDQAASRPIDHALRATLRRPDHTPGKEALLMTAAGVTATAAVWALLIAPARRRRHAAEHCIGAGTRESLDRNHGPAATVADRRRLPRVVHKISLVLHCELYSAVAVVAVVGLLLPAAGVLLHHWPLDRVASAARGGDAWAWELRVAMVVMAALGLLMLVGLGTCVARLLPRFFRDAVALGWRHMRPAPGEWRRLSLWGWWAEIAARLVVAVATLGYLTLNLWLAIDVARLPLASQGPFFHRLSDLGSGVSPALPLLLIAASFLCWATYHVRRSERLAESTAFEEAQSLVERTTPTPTGRYAALARAARAPRGRTEPRDAAADTARLGVRPAEARSPTGAVARAADDCPAPSIYSPEPSLGAYGVSCTDDEPAEPGEPTGHAGSFQDEGPHAPERGLPDAVMRLRAGLFRMFPARAGALVFGMMLLVGAWLWGHWLNTMEAVVLPRYFLHPRLAALPLAGAVQGLSAFDWLFRIGLLATVGATVLGLYRFIYVWLAFRRVLYLLSASPLLEAFRKLPKPVARLARLTPLDPPPGALPVLDMVIHDRWRTMQEIQARYPDNFSGTDGETVSALMNEEPFLARGRFDAELTLGAGYARLQASLDAASRLARGRRETHAPPTKDERLPIERWLGAAEECAAAYAVDYVEWVFRNLRLLAVTLLASLVLATILLSSYPFQPQSVLRLLFFCVLAAAVVSFVVVAVQMNRDLVLSNINQTTEARVDFDGTFLLNLALFALVPVFTLVSAEFPEVREFLFSWVTPLVRALGTG